jgi:hypothetical protein
MAIKSNRSFRYQERSREDVRERANMRGGNFDSIIKPAYKTYKVKDGKNLIRILPPTWEKPKHYGFDIFVNYNIGADNQSYLSLSKMKGQKDPLAEARQAAEREGDDELAKALRPTQRILMWIIDRLDEDEGPLLWAAPFTVDKAFANLAFDEDTKEVVFVDDPEEGCDVRFHKEGTGMLTKYDASKMKLMAAGPISQDEKQQDQWLEYIAENPIPDCLQYYDYDHIAGVFDGKVATPAEKTEEAKPARKVSTRLEPEDPDDEEAPAPKPTRPRIGSSGARASVPEDETEDEAPPPRRRAVPAEPDEPPATSIRDRIRQRRAQAAEAEEDE